MNFGDDDKQRGKTKDEMLKKNRKVQEKVVIKKTGKREIMR